MATNTLLTTDLITKELAYLLENESLFLNSISHGYDEKFSRDAGLGDTIRLRMPARAHLTSGANFTAQDYTEAKVDLQLGYRYNAGFSFTTQDMTLSMADYSKRTLQPIAERMATQVDSDIAAAMAVSAYNVVGTPGTTPGAASGSGIANTGGLDVITNAGMMLDHFSAGRKMRSLVANPTAMAGLSKTLSGMYNDKASISQIYKDGTMRGTHLGFNVGMDQNIPTYTSGTRANGTVNGANQTGATLNVIGAGNAATVNIGDRFTIANVYSVNPVNQNSTGQLQQFVVTANATCAANGQANLSIAPSIVVAGANVANGTVDSLPGNTVALTWVANASTACVNNLAYQQDAVVFASANLYLPDSAAYKARISHKGISLRVYKFLDGATDVESTRVDMLYGVAIRRPEHIAVVAG